MISKVLFIFFILVLINPFLGFCNTTEKDLKEQQSCGDYKVKIYRNADSTEGALKILKKDVEVYSEKGFSFQIGLIYDDIPAAKLVRTCRDITGEGIPNLVVSHWSGGAHCCFDFYVFALGKQFRLIDKLGADDADLSQFVDLNHNGKLDFLTSDNAFAYWNTSFAESPAPKVILRFKDGHYKLALDLMAKPLPSPQQERASLLTNPKEIAGDCSDKYGSWQKDGVCVTPDIWTHMLDLIYTGHPNEAWSFLDKHWKGDLSIKQWFIYDFKRRLVTSRYAKQLPVDLFGFESVENDRETQYLKTLKSMMNDVDAVIKKK